MCNGLDVKKNIYKGKKHLTELEAKATAIPTRTGHIYM